MEMVIASESTVATTMKVPALRALRSLFIAAPRFLRARSPRRHGGAFPWHGRLAHDSSFRIEDTGGSPVPRETSDTPPCLRASVVKTASYLAAEQIDFVTPRPS